MFSFLITLSIFTYLFWLFWVFVLRVSFSPGVRHSLLIAVASPVAEQGSGCTAFGSCGAQALGAQPSAAAEHGLPGARPSAAVEQGSGCTAFGSCGARALGAQPSAAVEQGSGCTAFGSCSTWAWWLWSRAPECRLSSPQAQLLPVRTYAFCIGRWILYHRAIREALVYFPH